MDQIRHLIASLLLLLAATVATAQSVSGLSNMQRVLGYTLTDSITTSGAFFGTADTYPVGALLASGSLEDYAGCKIVGIRFAVSQSIGRTRAFLYKVEGNGINEVYSQNQRTYEGWNNVFFNGDGIEIVGDESLLFGFDYVETEEMAAAEQGALCGFGEEDVANAFMAYGNFGSGEGFYSLSGIGCLCVQLIIDVSNLPAYNMGVSYLDAGFKYKQPGETIEALAMYVNTGREDVTAYQYGYQLDDRDPVVFDVSDLLVTGKSATQEFNVTLPSDISIGMHRLATFVNTVQGEAVTGKNTRMEQTFAVYRDKVERSKVYLEIYGDQASPYQPFFDEALSIAKKSAPYVSVAKVFNNKSVLGIDEAAYLCDLYAYTYPTFTINRAYFPGEAAIAYDMNDYLPVLPADMTAGFISDMAYQDYANPAFATLDLTATYDAASRQLRVSANGRLLPEAEAIYGDLALTLLVTEDSVKSRQSVYNQATGRSSYNANYLHNDVLRRFLTHPMGEQLTATDNQYTAEFTTDIPADWKPENMHVIALLTKAATTITEDNAKDYDVINCNSLSVAEVMTQGIENIQISNFKPQTSNFFTLDGKPVSPSQLRQGLYIERRADGQTRKIVVR